MLKSKEIDTTKNINSSLPLKGLKVCIVHAGVPRYDFRLKKTILMYQSQGAEVFVVAYLSTPEQDISDWQGVHSRCKLKTSATLKASENKIWLLRVAYNLSIFKARRLFQKFVQGEVGPYSGLAKLALAEEVDFYHIINADALHEFTKLGKKTRKPIIYELYEFYAAEFSRESLYSKKDRIKLKPLERHMVSKRASATIVVNEAIAEGYKSFYGNAEMIVVQNVALSRFEESTPLHDPLKFYFQSFLRPSYNIEALIDAFSRVEGRAELYIQGTCFDKTYEQQLKEYVAKSSKSSDIFLLEGIDHNLTVSAAHEYDVGVIPHTANTKIGYSVGVEHSTPNKLYTYGSAGLAMAVANYPTQRSLLEPFDCAYYFDPDSIDSIAQTLQEIVDDRDNLKKKKDNAIALGEAMSFDKEANHFGEKIAQVLKGNNISRRV